MTSIADIQVTDFLAPLASSSVRALVVASIAGFGLAAFRVKATSVRLFTWTAVLYAALAMPVLQWMTPALPVPAPTLLRHAKEQPAVDGLQLSPAKVSTVRLVPPANATLSTTVLTSQNAFTLSAIRWDLAAAGVYLAGLFFLFARFMVGLAFGYRLSHGSETIRDNRITVRLASHARADGLTFIPRAAESALISVPVTMGVLRPVVLLPTNWRDWDDAKLDAVIAHEVSHVARRDTLTQRLSLLHCAIFWFSPLSWWVHRHLADLMEQVSDEAALAGGADRKVYARTLLGFFEALQSTPDRVRWQGVAMATAGRAERRAEERVEKILGWKGVVAMRLKKSMVVAVVALAVPVVYVTASARPADGNVNPQNSKGVEIAQNQTPAPVSPTSQAARASKKSSNHSFYSYRDDDAQSFIIVSGGSASVTMSGRRGDWDQIEDLKNKVHGDFIWFRRDGKSYVIRDQATIDRAKAFWAPQEELGKKQEELGKQQEALGKQQEELSAKMEQVRVKVPDMTAELEKLQAALKKLNTDASMEQIGEIQSQIGELQSKIGDLQSRAGDQQSKLGEEMGALGEKQGKLGELQGELGRQQGELAEQAQRKMKALLDEAMAKGTAQLEN